MKATNLNVCLFPMEIIWGDKQMNLENLKLHMEKVHPDTDLIILPETFSTGFPSFEDKEYVRSMAERNTGETIELLKILAKKYNVGIAGSFIADSGGLLFNRAFFVEPSGDEYFADKRHLFSMAGESDIFRAGHQRLSVRFRGWNIAMIVCYDIRFPVWCRNVDNEYDLLIAVANWPEVRIDAWNKMLYVRAIENMSYVCGVNCKGTDSKGYPYDGSSKIIDFKGKDVNGTEIANSPFIYASLSKEKLDSFRQKFPAWKDRDIFKIDIS